MPRTVFRDLTSVIDEVHALFDAWTEAGAVSPPLDTEGLEVLRLAVHEWIANLVQHAAFPRGPEIVLDVETDAAGVRCAIEDASEGFDFAAQVERQHAVLTAPAPSERGRGLLMLVRCTEDLSYRPASGEARQRIAFRVAPPTPGDLFAPLFRPEDLTEEPGAFGVPSGDGAQPLGAAPLPSPPAPSRASDRPA